MPVSYHVPALTVMLVWAVAAPARAQTPMIDTLALRAHTYFLAHDLLEGRGAASVGERIAAQYIAAQCLRLGLRPVAGSYVHAVPLEEARVLPGTALHVATPRGTARFTYPDAVTPNVGTRATLSGFSGRAVWVGDDSTVVAGLGTLGLDSAVAVSAGVLGSPAMDTLRARGAVGVLHLTPSEEAYDLYRRSRGDARLYHRDTAVTSSFFPSLPSVIGGPVLIPALLGRRRGIPERPGPLESRIGFTVTLERRAVETRNVTCVAPGSGPAGDTAIALTAHYDHLGVGAPDAAGDSIYNGFSDNAAGVAMLLAIAAALAHDPPRHSILFLFPGGEERGLLGSDHYVFAPAWPLPHTKAVINLDAGAPPAPPVSWRLAGPDGTVAMEAAQRIATRAGWAVTTSPARPNSDYYPFVRRGVPAVFIIPGGGPYDGLSEEASNALRRRWDRYHRLEDEWHVDFPFAGLARYAGYALLVVRELSR